MPIPHFHFLHRRHSGSRRRDRIIAIAIVANLMAAGIVLALIFGRGHRRPPSIFDTPVDDVSEYLASRDFNALSTKDRLEYIQGILKRFSSMSQTDSAVASAFFAGLSGKASEQLMNNARTLGKDILIEGARDYLALKTDDEKSKFIDQWLVNWVRFADGMNSDGRPQGAGSDDDILGRLSRQTTRDAQRAGDIGPVVAQRLMDFWTRDIASVASPKEQGQLVAFLPAIRDHLVQRGK